MRIRSVQCIHVLVLGVAFTTAGPIAAQQLTPDDYARADELRERFRGLAVDIVERVEAVPETAQFWYRKSVTGGSEFVLVDAEAATRGPAFDHARLADSLTEAAGREFTATTLPFTSFEFTGGAGAIGFAFDGERWECDLGDYLCSVRSAAADNSPVRELEPESAAPREYGNDVYDGMVELPPQGQRPPQGLQVPGQQRPRGGARPRVSPDGAWEAVVVDDDLVIRPAGADADPDASAAAGASAATGAGSSSDLRFEGSEDDYYSASSIAWSPDSSRLAVYRVQPGDRRQVHYIESSPADQVQPRHWVRDYAKPGDGVDIAQPVLIDIESQAITVIDDALFPNPYSLSNPVWRDDGRAFTFEYNQRGHQVYRIVEVDAGTGSARAVISEESPTFFAYRPLVPNRTDTGKRYRYDLNDGQEVIWMSERDGWAHLYLYDGVTGEVKNQITAGDWVVRGVERVDEEARQIWFLASGMHADQDPYFLHYYRIDFDGAGLTALTDGDGNHSVVFSDDRQYYVDTWSRVDQAPVAELRRTSDQALLMELERGDVSALRAAGWRPPEVFSAKGRDGDTDIWGIIHRPVDFDPSRQYPVIESIYAGPQGSFVPKDFRVAVQSLTELGFIVVQIDGMGTNNRSKAFHDVAFKNLGDAGLPDRILWHRAVAESYSYYDVSRVGIYGTSAGGQSALGALLFHPEFYKVAVSNSGCHDNRMDKIWWNEHWMSWPVGPEYAASSNVDNAHLLQGELLLVVGELDTNVDPASTLQVANALIEADKQFDLLYVPGGGHGAGGDYYQRLMQDFFVEHLLEARTPDWNLIAGAGSP